MGFWIVIAIAIILILAPLPKKKPTRQANGDPISTDPRKWYYKYQRMPFDGVQYFSVYADTWEEADAFALKHMQAIQDEKCTVMDTVYPCMDNRHWDDLTSGRRKRIMRMKEEGGDEHTHRVV